MKQDTLHRIVCDTLDLRIYAASSLDTTRMITGIHETTPNATVALGRTVTATALLAATMKPGSAQSVAVKFSGDGPLHEVYAQADANGNVRGYTSCPRMDEDEDLGRISFSKAIGAGFLTVIRDTGTRDPYRTVLPLLYGDIAADVTHYLAASEQIPSALILGFDLDRDGGIDAAGGILFQTFPNTKHEVIEKLDTKIRGMEVPLGKQLKNGTDILDIISSLLDNEPLSLMESTPLRANCRCDREMLQSVLRSVELDELKAMLAEDGKADITCTFCRSHYHFTADDLAAIIREKEKN